MTGILPNFGMGDVSNDVISAIEAGFMEVMSNGQLEELTYAIMD